MIFIGEDTLENENPIQIHLSNEKFETKAFSDADKLFKELKNSIFPSLFILHNNFLKKNGTDFIKTLRTEYKASSPVIIVHENAAEDEIIKCLDLGANDFLSEPFSPKLLMAHVNAQLRITELFSADTENCIRFGEYSLFLCSSVLKKNGIKIPLSEKEYEVLAYMVKNAGEILSPAQIYENVWKIKFGDITAVAVYIQRLRKKIEKDFSRPLFIKTIFGQGYSFSKDSIKR